MIAKIFDKPRPMDLGASRGWAAEERVAFLLRRAFEQAPDVHVLHDLRLPAVSNLAGCDYFQMDHVVVHRHGIVIVESKATGDGTGEFHVDRLGQWQRRPAAGRKAYNIQSPVEQAKVQAEALRAFLDAATPPLLGKFLGLRQARFDSVPISVFVAIADDARLTGDAAQLSATVMKAERIVSAIQQGIATERDAVRGVNFRPATTARILDYLLNRHVPAPTASTRPPGGTAASSESPAAGGQSRVAPRPTRQTASEALSCAHCRSIRVGVVYRRDYCLQCEECGKYTPLERRCAGCGRPATVRKRGAEFYRACDLAGGCGAEVVFWRADEA